MIQAGPNGSVSSEGTFPASYQNFIHKGHYARFIHDEVRREDWDETVSRYMDFMKDHLKERCNYDLPKSLEEDLFQAILNRDVMPSMRALQTAGEALRRDEVAGYNCSYVPVDSIDSLHEAIYILSCGAGVGFSVEKYYTEKLPSIPKHFTGGRHIVVGDSKYGWAEAFKELLEALYSGKVPSWDISGVRPKGARLKTFGGRASGPEPLQDLFEFTMMKFMGAKGRKLRPIELMDIVCKIGEIVVSGGVRRSALICLSDLEDEEIQKAKVGEWCKDNPQRGMANLSVVYDSTPDLMDFSMEWMNLVSSGSGERGIFNREAATKQARRSGRRDVNHRWGTNPCSEILLRPFQFCNLSSVIIRPDDSVSDLRYKVRLASILGTFQATLTNFTYLRDQWEKNTREERLLGVSMTGQMGHTLLSGQLGYDNLAHTLDDLREEAVATNEKFARSLGIPQATAVTCVKPEGTSSQLVGTSSGMHPWYNNHYVRTVRGSKDDPLTQFLIDKGVPYEDDLMAPDRRVVFSFPVKAPDYAVTRKDISAIDHLELWKVYQDHWCEHKPSITISVKDEEWGKVGSWVYSNFDSISGISFLPYEDHTYKQAPYQDITEEEYNELVENFPTDINYSELADYEIEDTTSGGKTLACTGAESCELVDLG